MPGLSIYQHLLLIGILSLVLLVKICGIRYLWREWWRKD